MKSKTVKKYRKSIMQGKADTNHQSYLSEWLK